MRSAGVATGITGDGTVLAAWGGGASDDGGVWVRSSADRGASWSAPRRIASSCSAVLSLATTAEGWVVVLASGFRRVGETADPRTTLVVRTPDGAWRAPQTLDLPGIFGSIVISGDGAAARAVALIGVKDERSATLLTQPLAAGGAWRMERRTIALPSDGTADFFWHMRGTTFARQQTAGAAQAGVVFSWTRRDHGEIFAIESLDGGQSWGPIEQVRRQTSDDIVLAAAPAYDPAHDRLVVLYTCCADQRETTASVHYAAWSAPGSGAWTLGRAPLLLHDRAVDQTVVAQAANSRQLWLAWVEEGQRVEVRRWDLDKILPREGDGS
jgi:hypothetical protein